MSFWLPINRPINRQRTVNHLRSAPVLMLVAQNVTFRSTALPTRDGRSHCVRVSQFRQRPPRFTCGRGGVVDLARTLREVCLRACVEGRRAGRWRCACVRRPSCARVGRKGIDLRSHRVSICGPTGYRSAGKTCSGPQPKPPLSVVVTEKWRGVETHRATVVSD